MGNQDKSEPLVRSGGPGPADGAYCFKEGGGFFEIMRSSELRKLEPFLASQVINGNHQDDCQDQEAGTLTDQQYFVEERICHGAPSFLVAALRLTSEKPGDVWHADTQCCCSFMSEGECSTGDLEITLRQLGDDRLEYICKGVRKEAQRSKHYAFYNMMRHINDYRYVFTPGCQDPRPGDGDPLIGKTAGWLPVIDHGSGPADAGQFPGPFWDPFHFLAANGHKRHYKNNVWRIVPTPRRQPVARRTPRPSLSERLPNMLGKPTSTASASASSRQWGRHYSGDEWKREVGSTTFKGKERRFDKPAPELTLSFKDFKKRPSMNIKRPRPELSIVCVRWAVYWSDPKPSDYKVFDDSRFMLDLFVGQKSVDDLMHGEYEIYTIFVQGGEDLDRLRPRVAHVRNALRGKRCAAWYLVWPEKKDHTRAEEWSAGGFVAEESLFDFMRAMENAGIPTGWPHRSTLYQRLADKSFLAEMSKEDGDLKEQLKCLLTVELEKPRATKDATKDYQIAALSAIRELLRLKKLQQERQNGVQRSLPRIESFKGVVKLGYSWGGEDVWPFTGWHELAVVARKLLEERSCSNPNCWVQEFVENVFAEHRVMCFWDARKGEFITEGTWVEVEAAGDWHGLGYATEGFGTASSSMYIPRSEYFQQSFFGNDVERHRGFLVKADQLARDWLNHIKTAWNDGEEVHHIRIDFLAVKAENGRDALWTGELSECGSSLCTIHPKMRNIAVLNYALSNTQDVRSHPFPEEVANGIPSSFGPFPFPAPVPRNNGELS